MFVLGAWCRMLLAEPLAKFLGPWINTIYQLILAVVRERVYSPEKVLAVLFNNPSSSRQTCTESG